jgi:NAD(P)-dependent dehydrogenase (short-subunit alcohol dehydrogenase family)
MYGDVTNRELPEVLKRDLPKAVTHLDLLVNNAGVSGRTSKIADLDMEELMHLMDVHCYGPIRCIQGCLDLLHRAPRPTIVNVSSRLGSVARVATGSFDELNVSYAMRISKAAQNMLSAALIRELGPLGVRVLAVHPGQVTTRMASRDALMSPEDAARRFVDWLLADGGPSAGFFEPEQGSVSW